MALTETLFSRGKLHPYPRYNNFIQQAQEILNSKVGLYKKENLERVV